jgi:hypothetical protein
MAMAHNKCSQIIQLELRRSLAMNISTDLFRVTSFLLETDNLIDEIWIAGSNYLECD